MIFLKLLTYLNLVIPQHIDETRHPPLHWIRQVFRWTKMATTIKEFIQGCDVCQRNKNDNLSSKGLLYPLPIQERVWEDMSMDFVEGLPKSEGKTVVFMAADRLSQLAHFILTTHPYTAQQIAKPFFTQIFKLRMTQDNCVSQRCGFSESILARSISPSRSFFQHEFSISPTNR